MLNTKLCLIGYAAAQERQYSRLVKQMKPDLEEYQEQKEKLFVFYNFFLYQSLICMISSRISQALYFRSDEFN